MQEALTGSPLTAVWVVVGRERRGPPPPGTGSRALPQPLGRAASGTEESQSHAHSSWPVCACRLVMDKFTQAPSTLTSETQTTPPDLRVNIPKASMLRPPKDLPFLKPQKPWVSSSFKKGENRGKPTEHISRSFTI